MSLSVNMNCHVIVDDLPANIAPEKKDAFLRLFSTKVKSMLGARAVINVRLVDDKDGFVAAAFLELSSPTEADAAISKLHGFAFTKTCTFSAYRWSDFEKAESTPDKYEPLEEDEEGGDAAVGGGRDMTNTFLLDEAVRPQLLVKSGENYDVSWSYLNTKSHVLDMIRSTTVNYDRAPWCELDKRAKKLQKPPAGKRPFPQWTSRGTYLISQNTSSAGASQQLLKFWGGASMQLCAEVTYSAGELDDLIVSNTEQFCIVKSKEIAFWNIAEGRLIRRMPRSGRGAAAGTSATAEKPAAAEKQQQQQQQQGAAAAAAASAAKAAAAAAEEEDDSNIAFQYNADDTLVGGVSRTAAGKHGITLYVGSSMKLVTEDVTSKFSQTIPGVMSMSFSPTNPKMYAYVAEGDSNSGGWRVHIENVTVNHGDGSAAPAPTFVSLCKRSWTNVTHIGLLWHPSGEFLAARLTKQQGEVKSVEYCVFRTHTNNVSAELFDPKGESRRFVFQPNAPRFALLVVPAGQTALIKRQHLQFFYIDPKVGIKRVTDVEHDADRVIWAPKGCRCVAVNMDKSIVDFFGVSGCGPFPPAPHAPMEKIQEKNSSESGAVPNTHPCPSDFDWDPTGRYFCAVTSSLTHTIDNLLSIWNVNGRIVLQQKQQRLSHAAFRPLPKVLIPDAELQRIRRDLSKKSAEYDTIALAEAEKSNATVNDKKSKVEKKFLDVMQVVQEWHEEENFAARRRALIESAPMYKRLMEKAIGSPAALATASPSAAKKNDDDA